MSDASGSGAESSSYVSQFSEPVTTVEELEMFDICLLEPEEVDDADDSVVPTVWALGLVLAENDEGA